MKISKQLGLILIENSLIPFKGYSHINIWYFLEWLIEFGDSHKAYKNISFEKEAKINESNLEYLKSRKLYSWIKFI